MVKQRAQSRREVISRGECAKMCQVVIPGRTNAKQKPSRTAETPALPEDRSLFPSTHIAAFDHLQLHFQGIWCLALASRAVKAHMWYKDIYEGKTLKYIQKLFSSFFFSLFEARL